MGKAIVIKGLNVVNPIAQVTIYDNPEDAVLANYLTANQSINTTETAALKTLVGSLVENDLWDKFKYFYPLLGNSVTDMFLEVIDTNNEDIMTNSGTNGLSVSNRKLISNNRSQSSKNIGNRAKSLDASKLGFICASSLGETLWGAKGFRFNHGSSTFTGFDIVSSSGYQFPIYYNGTEIKDDSGEYKVKERVIFGTIDNGQGSLYNKNLLLASGAVTIPTDPHPRESYGVLFNLGISNNCDYTFFAITEGMTTEDWSVVYPLIYKFLQDVGKAE